MTAGRCLGTIWGVGLLERLEEVQARNEWSAAEWARRARLSETTHVSTIKRRLRENPDAEIERGTLTKLASAAGVSVDWLASGAVVSPGAHILVEADSRYPTRGQAITAARIFCWSERAIGLVLAVDSFPDDPGLDYWLSVLRSHHEAELRSAPDPRPEVKKSGAARKGRGE